VVPPLYPERSLGEIFGGKRGINLLTQEKGVEEQKLPLQSGG